MNEFYLWFSTGFSHILDWEGYDHILYVMLLSVMFTYKEWKKTIVLITAFTIGHSLTLAASVLHLLQVNQQLIELLIPLTIIVTAISVFVKRNSLKKVVKLNYLLALFFGFIHGMGFSYLLKSMLGKEESMVFPLFAFNTGIEIGQLIIVCFMLLFSIFLIKFIKINNKYWVLFVVSIVLVIACKLFIDRFINFYL